MPFWEWFTGIMWQVLQGASFVSLGLVFGLVIRFVAERYKLFDKIKLPKKDTITAEVERDWNIEIPEYASETGAEDSPSSNEDSQGVDSLEEPQGEKI